MPNQGVHLHPLLPGHHIHTDRYRREGREELRPHEIGKVHMTFGTPGEDRTPLFQTGQELAGIEAVVDEATGVLVALKGQVEEGSVQLVIAHPQSSGLGEVAEETHPGVQIGGEVVGVTHACRIAGRGGHRIDFRVQVFQPVFQNHHGENRGAGRDVARPGPHGVGGHHPGAGISFGRSHDRTCCQGARRVQQTGACFGQGPRLLPRHQGAGQEVAYGPGLGGNLRQAVEGVEHGLVEAVIVRVDGEHTRGITYAKDLAPRELPVHIAGQGGDEGHLGHVLLLVENGLVQVGYGPALGDVDLECPRKALMGLTGVGVPPGAEGHQEPVVLIEGQVPVHHGRKSHGSDTGQRHTVAFPDLGGQGGIGTLKSFPDLLQGVGPQAVLELILPGKIAIGQGVVILVDQYGLDSGRAQLDTQGGPPGLDFLSEVPVGVRFHGPLLCWPPLVLQTHRSLKTRTVNAHIA